MADMGVDLAGGIAGQIFSSLDGDSNSVLEGNELNGPMGDFLKNGNFDTNGDHKISKQELTEGLSHMSLEDLFKMLDALLKNKKPGANAGGGGQGNGGTDKKPEGPEGLMAQIMAMIQSLLGGGAQAGGGGSS